MSENVLLDFKSLCNSVKYSYCVYPLKKLISVILCMIVKYYLSLDQPILALHALLYSHEVCSLSNSGSYKDGCHDGNINTKPLFELIEYAMERRMESYKDRMSRNNAIKFISLLKVIHSSLYLLQDIIPKHDIEEQLYNFKENKSIINEINEYEVTIINSLSSLQFPISILELISLIPEERRQFLINYFAFIVSQILLYEEHNKIKYLTTDRYKELLTDKEILFYESINKHIISKVVNKEIINKLKNELETQCQLNGFTLSIFCFNLSPTLLINDSAVIYLCIKQMSLTPHIEKILTDFVVKDYRVMMKKPEIIKSHIEEVGVILNRVPEPFKETLREKLIEHYVPEFIAMVSTLLRKISISDISYREDNEISNINMRKIIGVRDIINLSNAIQGHLILLKIIDHHLKCICIALVNELGQKTLFTVNAQRIRSYYQSPDSVLGGIESVAKLKEFFKNIIQTKRNMRGVIFRFIKTCWLLKIISRIARYKNTKNTIKRFIYMLKLSNFNGPTLNPIEELAETKIVSEKDVNILRSNVKLYCGDMEALECLKQVDFI